MQTVTKIFLVNLVIADMLKSDVFCDLKIF